jgi:hypothetical protein
MSQKTYSLAPDHRTNFPDEPKSGRREDKGGDFHEAAD